MTYVFAASVIYPWLIVRIGFVLSTILYSFTLMKLFKTKTSISLFISASVAIGLFLFFVKVLEAFVPSGAWMDYAIEMFTEEK